MTDRKDEESIEKLKQRVEILEKEQENKRREEARIAHEKWLESLTPEQRARYDKQTRAGIIIVICLV